MIKSFEAIRGQQGTIAVLDIGSAKVVALIARILDNNQLEVIGVGHQIAKGIRSGQILDAGEAQHSITSAVHSAEQMAGVTIESVFVSVNGAHLRSRSIVVELDVTTDGVSDEDILDLIAEGTRSVEEEGREIIHLIPVQYYLDKAKGLTDPRGMVGEVLGAELHFITADRLVLQNLSSTIARCHLNTLGYVMAPLASARAVLSADEMELGACVIDMGAGTTSICAYSHGRPFFTASIPVGGKHVTSDIARGLSTSLAQAERIKSIHANAMGSPKDAEMTIDVPQLGEEEEDADSIAQLPRSALTGVVRPRMEEMFELVKQKLDDAGITNVTARHCVLTGGGSQMIGINDMATKMLAKQVRKGKPHPIEGIADIANSPSFATATGMLYLLIHESWEDRLLRQPKRYLGFFDGWRRMKHWLRETI
jgi:cell division protein FtsA